MDESVEQQDSRGWTPIMWSSSNGYCKLVRQLIQRGADVHHIGQAKGGNGTTMALHECAAMRGEKGQAPEAYYETAWLLMAAGASPFAERSDGMIPVEVAAANGNLQMKTFLEGCCLFRGTLAMPVPQAFGSKIKSRYCTVQPRFPQGNAAPTLWMICYRSVNELPTVCRIPLGNARVMIEGPQDSNNGIIIIPNSSKVSKGVAVKSHTSNSSIIEVRAVPQGKTPGWKTLRTLADVCKAAGVAVSCRSLDQLCNAALAQAVQQMRLPGTDVTPSHLEEGAPTPGGVPASVGSQKNLAVKVGQPTQLADSAQDMLPARSITRMPSIPNDSTPSTPRNSSMSSAANPSRRSGIGSMFKSAFRMSSSTAPRFNAYNSQILDSSSSVGQMSQMSSASQEPAKKSGLWSFKGKKKSGMGMPSIIEQQSAGGLTDADISAFSQPAIPDKFWSKMGRKMSSQSRGRPLPPSYRSNVETWFHEDNTPAPGLPPTASRPKKSFEYDDLNELMYPGQKPPAAKSNAPPGPGINMRRQTSDGMQARASQNGSVPFILEEPIVPTQRMVNAGPRRSFSFDDLDDMVSGGNRKARGHREDFSTQMAPGSASRLPPSSQVSMAAQPGRTPYENEQMRIANRGHQLSPFPANLTKTRSNSMPRRSFSFHDLDQLLQAPPPAAQAPPSDPEAVQKSLQADLLAWQQSQGTTMGQKKRGPAIDPTSYGGFQGAPAPEWRPYKPASARQSQSQQQPQQQQVRPVQAQQRHSQSAVPQQGAPRGSTSRVPSQDQATSHLRLHPQSYPHPGHAGPPTQPARHSSQQAPPLQRAHSGQPARHSSQQAPHLQQGVPGAAPQHRHSSQQAPPLQQSHQHPHAGQQRVSAGEGRATSVPNCMIPSRAPSGRRSAGMGALQPSKSGSLQNSKSLEGAHILPELAHLASLRALDTGRLSSSNSHLSTASPRVDSLANTQDLPVDPTPAASSDATGKRPAVSAAPVQAANPPVSYEADDRGAKASAASPAPENIAAKANASSGPAAVTAAPVKADVSSKRTAAAQTERTEAAPAKIATQAAKTESPTPTSPSSVQPTSPTPPATPAAPAVPSVLFTGTKQPKIATPPTRIRKESDEVPEIRHSGSHEYNRNSN